jgi:hypothetical protein
MSVAPMPGRCCRGPLADVADGQRRDRPPEPVIRGNDCHRFLHVNLYAKEVYAASEKGTFDK